MPGKPLGTEMDRMPGIPARAPPGGVGCSGKSLEAEGRRPGYILTAVDAGYRRGQAEGARIAGVAACGKGQTGGAQLGDGERGYCGVRENRGGTCYTLVYSRVCVAHADPIEKKPLFHYLPGTNAFSIATAGCNVNCKFCHHTIASAWHVQGSGDMQ